MAKEPSALDVQVGGEHYKNQPIQPIEYIVKNKISFLAGNVIKYISRYAFKKGPEDVEKAIHYCQFILEFEYPEYLAKKRYEDSKKSPGILTAAPESFTLDEMALAVEMILERAKHPQVYDFKTSFSAVMGAIEAQRLGLKR